jgi:two-component system response regulator WspF
MRIGIVNDVALAREALRRVVLSVPGLQVAWTANDGAEAVEQTVRDCPDVILMDLFMPRMDGAEATRQIMAVRPCPVLVVTATVSGHIHKVYEAMGHGAIDAVDTPTLGPHGELEGALPLLTKIVLVGKVLGTPVDVSGAGLPAQPLYRARPPVRKAGHRLVLIGASTGGPAALKRILNALPTKLDASVIVVQHVDMAFAPGLVSWLGEGSSLPVELVREGQQPLPGRVFVAGTNDHLILGPEGRLHYTAEPLNLCYRPSVDVLFQSVAERWAEPGLAALLTGMGRDGAAGLGRLRERGWHTIAQDQQTCVVWGMPRAAVECGAAIEVLSIDRIGKAIVESV